MCSSIWNYEAQFVFNVTMFNRLFITLDFYVKSEWLKSLEWRILTVCFQFIDGSSHWIVFSSWFSLEDIESSPQEIKFSSRIKKNERIVPVKKSCLDFRSIVTNRSFVINSIDENWDSTENKFFLRKRSNEIFDDREKFVPTKRGHDELMVKQKENHSSIDRNEKKNFVGSSGEFCEKFRIDFRSVDLKLKISRKYFLVVCSLIWRQSSSNFVFRLN